MNLSSMQLRAMCRGYGPQLALPDGINGARLLYAISCAESDYGANISPRHEPAYCPITNGKYADGIHVLTEAWGCLAHCSFGPWQLMACNSLSYSPLELLDNMDACALATVAFINREILAAQKATTVAEIADAYNSGTWRDRIIPAAYIAKVSDAYDLANFK